MAGWNAAAPWASWLIWSPYFFGREAGDGELAAIHTQTRYVDSFRRRVVRDVNDLLKVRQQDRRDRGVIN
jgi:hypothetical protein